LSLSSGQKSETREGGGRTHVGVGGKKNGIKSGQLTGRTCKGGRGQVAEKPETKGLLRTYFWGARRSWGDGSREYTARQVGGLRFPRGLGGVGEAKWGKSWNGKSSIQHGLLAAYL